MKKPKIRFNGFNDDWEQRKFVEFVKNAAKKNKDNIDLEPYAVTNDRGFIAQKDAHDDFGYMSNVDRTAYNIVPPNSFAYNPARINVGSLGYYEGTENVIVSSLYEVFQTEEYIDDKFLLHWFKSDSFPRWIEKLQEGSVRLYFYFDKLVQCQMMVPSLEEQKRISAYLDSIDQLITLHQRKCDEVKSLKKYMLQKMFPQNEQKVPEIRFEGFTEAWEQRKLIEVCDYVDYRGKTPTKTENGIFLVTAKNVKDGFIDYETSKEYISENAYEEVMRRGKPEIGDVLITTEAPCGNVAQVNKADIALAQRIIKYRGHIGVVDNTYLKYYLLSPEFQKILNAKSSGGTVQGIKGSILHQQKIIYPSYEEQKKIGQHMDSLDHLITLHQQKCEELKKIKKFMLQKMFV